MNLHPTASHDALAPETRVIFLMGATACGKTANSVELAKRLDAEIISVDSALVYRGMDIGTAKPDLAERAGIAHHLIDICEPWQPYSVAQFCNDANALIGQIHRRGKRVLLVGGTMLYFKSLEQGLAKLPEADAQIRASLVAEANLHGWPALHQQLQAIDPDAALRIHPNDPQRLQRALEVYRLTGVPMSELLARTQSDLVSRPIKFALMPANRAWLHERIQLRFRTMIAAGFMEELIHLHSDKRLHIDLPSIRSVGYRQGWEFLDSRSHGVSDEAHSAAQEAWQERAIVATRQLAKRQLTWLRSMDNIVGIQCDTQSRQMQIDSICEYIDQQKSGPTRD